MCVNGYFVGAYLSAAMKNTLYTAAHFKASLKRFFKQERIFYLQQWITVCPQLGKEFSIFMLSSFM